MGVSADGRLLDVGAADTEEGVGYAAGVVSHRIPVSGSPHRVSDRSLVQRHTTIDRVPLGPAIRQDWTKARVDHGELVAVAGLTVRALLAPPLLACSMAPQSPTNKSSSTGV